MATTIKSTALDFNNIKNNLKYYLKNQEEFSDYNFEASGLSNILDVLAYNTHINALIANFVANESYLDTAQLRSSVVSLAETLGYSPYSNTSARATVTISCVSASAPPYLTLPAYTQFTGTINNTTYTFLTAKNYYATESVGNSYTFFSTEGDPYIELFEGRFDTATFVAPALKQYSAFHINSDLLDTSTVTVKVYPQGSSSYLEYYNINTFATIDDETQFFILRESPTGGYDLIFGDSNGFGKAPVGGDTIVVEYIEGKGNGNAAGIGQFSPIGELEWTTYNNGIPSTGSVNLTVVGISPSAGGQGKEPIASIKTKAPYNYATQNRAITAQDYSSLIQRSFGEYLQDVVSWGGQDNIDPEYGAIYISLNFNSTLADIVRVTVRNNILDLQKKLGILSYRLRFVEPDITYVSIDGTTYYNPIYTSSAAATIDENVREAISEYFSENIDSNRFNQSVQTSGILSYMKDANPGILGNDIDVVLQKRLNLSSLQFRNALSTLADLVPLTSAQLNELVQLAFNNRFKQIANNLLLRNEFSDVVHSSQTYLNIVNSLNEISGTSSKRILFPVELGDPTKMISVIDSSIFVYANKNCKIKNIPNTYNLGIYDVGSDTLINNIGNYTPDGIVELNYIDATSYSGDSLKIYARPNNRALVTTDRNELIQYDPNSTKISLVKTSSKG